MKKTNNLYLVTGGAGFIGSHVVEKLIDQGYEVLIIDDFTSGSMLNIPKSKKIRIINKKIEDVNFKEIMKANGIFHLAAQASVPISINDFYNSSQNNLVGTLKVFEWAKNYKIPIVYASSSAIYGNLPIGDDSKKDYDILSPYAQDKLTMEDYALLLFKLYGINSLGLRFFNVYGPRQDPTNPYSGVISIFIDRILKSEPVLINGGYQTRDFIYISDITDVLIKSMKVLHKKNMCDFFNVGTGVSVSIDNLFLTLTKITKTNPKIIRKNLSKSDPEKSSGTYKKIKNILDVDIKIFNSLEPGLLSTYKYFKSINNKGNNEVL